MSIKNTSDTFRNRTRDLPACSAVPQPTAPPGLNSGQAYLAIRSSNVRLGLEGILWTVMHTNGPQKRSKLKADEHSAGNFGITASACNSYGIPTFQNEVL